MKILHLSDLHLGKRVFEYSMIAEQRVILDQALEMAKAADVTVIAGDIYDRQVPPAEAVSLFDSFLTRMSAQGSPVLLVAGNHDSAERIAFGSGLLGGRRHPLESRKVPHPGHLLEWVLEAQAGK